MPAKRLNDSALGALERPALAWAASRLPEWITPGHLTAIGLIGALAAATGYCASRWSLQWLWLASAGLFVNWVGDSLDGTLARLRHIERPRYGFFVDHTSDLFAQTAVFLGLGASPCAHFGVACLALVTFLGAFVYSLICLRVRNSLRITYFGFGPTEIRALLIAGNLLTVAYGVLDVGPWILPREWRVPVTVYELVIVIICSLAMPALAMLAAREARKLAGEDPLPAPTRSAAETASAAQVQQAA